MAASRRQTLGMIGKRPRSVIDQSGVPETPPEDGTIWLGKQPDEAPAPTAKPQPSDK